jgi:hypothetical protein
MAAGVRSIIITPSALSLRAVLGVHIGAGGVEGDLHAVGQHVRQQAVDALGGGLEPISRARFRPFGVGVDADHPHRLEHRRCAAACISRSVPMLPGPIRAHLIFLHGPGRSPPQTNSNGPNARADDEAQAADAADEVTRRLSPACTGTSGLGDERSGEDHLAGLQRDAVSAPSVLASQATALAGAPERRGAGAGGDDLAVLLEHHAACRAGPVLRSSARAGRRRGRRARTRRRRRCRRRCPGS